MPAASKSILDHLNTNSSSAAYGDVNPTTLDHKKLKNLFDSRRATTDLHYGSNDANHAINAASKAAEQN